MSQAGVEIPGYRPERGEWRPLQLGRMSPALVVEDSFLAASELRRLLRRWDVETHIASRPDAALALAAQLRPKLALVDINLEGGFEGLDVARDLQILHKTKIVFVTAYHVRDLMHRMNGAENAAVLFKPVDPDVLAAVLSKLALPPH